MWSVLQVDVGPLELLLALIFHEVWALILGLVLGSKASYYVEPV